MVTKFNPEVLKQAYDFIKALPKGTPLPSYFEYYPNEAHSGAEDLELVWGEIGEAQVYVFLWGGQRVSMVWSTPRRVEGEVPRTGFDILPLNDDKTLVNIACVLAEHGFLNEDTHDV